MADGSAPKICLWYGNRQVFGCQGQPQRWINLLGRVYSPHRVTVLQYSLNDEGWQDLSIGPDYRRLVAPGDFNIDIDIRRLQVGDNKVTMVVFDEAGGSAVEHITVVFQPHPCELPYRVEWEKVSEVQQAVTVVDGVWVKTGATISPYEIGYDRLLALGDMSWTDYEVTVPITIHGMNGACYKHPSIHAGVGVVMRWKGHSEWGPDEYASGQPHFGPGPYGAIGWYCVFSDIGSVINFFDPQFRLMAYKPCLLELHKPYWFKISVQTLETGESLYSMKVWEQAGVEPEAWDITARGQPSSLSEGSCMLVAHHVAASFGNVSILRRL